MRFSRLLSPLRRHLTYSNVIASLALFIALGGVSYAAIKIPANSVGTKQLKKGAVTGAKVKKGAVTGAKVKKGSLLARNFKAGQLPRGPQGERGPIGPPGEGGLFVGPAVNSGLTPSGDGWQIAQTVSGSLSGLFRIYLARDYRITCPAEGADCDFESGLRINGEFADESLYGFPSSVSSGSSLIRNFPSFGFYDLSGTTEISLIYRQVSGSTATVEILTGNPGFYMVERIEELNQTSP